MHPFRLNPLPSSVVCDALAKTLCAAPFEPLAGLLMALEKAPLPSLSFVRPRQARVLELELYLIAAEE